MAEAFTDEEIELIRNDSEKWLRTHIWRHIDRFLDTITQYEKALDSAMRQVSSLNEGNITDRKLIKELRQIKESDTATKKDHRVKMKADRKRIEELELAGEDMDKTMSNIARLSNEKSKTIADQTATIERLKSDCRDMTDLLRRWIKGFTEAESVDGIYKVTQALMDDLQKQADDMLTKIESRKALDAGADNRRGK